MTYKWVETWGKDLKKIQKLAPSTVTKHVGALARCLDSGLRAKHLSVNPLHMLPKGYATYTNEDSR